MSGNSRFQEQGKLTAEDAWKWLGENFRQVEVKINPSMLPFFLPLKSLPSIGDSIDRFQLRFHDVNHNTLSLPTCLSISNNISNNPLGVIGNNNPKNISHDLHLMATIWDKV